MTVFDRQFRRAGRGELEHNRHLAIIIAFGAGIKAAVSSAVHSNRGACPLIGRGTRLGVQSGSIGVQSIVAPTRPFSSLSWVISEKPLRITIKVAAL